MHSFSKVILFHILLFISVTSVFSQVSISNPGCVVVGKSYIYNYVGSYTSSTTMTWCVSNNGTILQAYGSNITGTGSCRSGTVIGSIYVQWNSSGPGSVTLTSSNGNASPLDFTIANALVPGSLTANVTQTITYNTIPASINCGVATFGYCTPAYAYQWQQSADNVNWTNISGLTSQNLSFSTGLIATTYFRRKVTETNTSTILYSNVATVTVTPPFSQTVISPATQSIYTGTAPSAISGPEATGGNCGGSYAYQWQFSVDGGTTYSSISGATGLEYSPGTLTQTTYYRRKDTCGGEISFSNASIVNVFQHLSAGTITPAALTVTYNTSPGYLTATSPAGDMCTPLSYTYQWQVSSDGIIFSDIPGATTYLGYNPGSLLSTCYFRRKVTCIEVAYSNIATITVNPQLFPGSIIPGSIAIPAGSSPGILFADAGTGGTCDNAFSYQWQSSPDGSTFTNIVGATTQNYTPGNLTTTTYYRRKITCDIDVLYTNVCTVAILTGPVLYNYVQVRDISKAGVITETAAAALTDPGVVALTTQYVDDLGRVMQIVNYQGSPSKKDIVQFNVYDAFEREPIKYLPYVSINSDGKYNTQALSSQSVFYDNGVSDKIIDDPNPYSQIRFELSPLNRIVEQGSLGSSWQPDADNSYTSNDHTVKHDYASNGVSEVILFTYDATTGLIDAGSTVNYYDINQLQVNKTKDEQGNEVIEYVDKVGHTVCKKVQSGTDGSSNKLFACTYYIYDDFGNLVVVLPPEGVKALVPSAN